MAKISEVYFEESPHEQSIIKKLIVVKYFKAWAKIMKSNIIKFKRDDRIGYLDLFCGPGKHKTGETSTPLEIMEHILSDEFLSERCVTFFNDCNKEYIKQLKESIESLDNYESLKYKPHYKSLEVNDAFFEELKDVNLIPSLSFIDPFGYCGVSVDLLNVLIRSFGCDVILFFNYNDINRGLTNSTVLNRYGSHSKVRVSHIIYNYVETVYVPKNIKAALLELEDENKLCVIEGRSHKGTMPDKAIIKIINNRVP